MKLLKKKIIKKRDILIASINREINNFHLNNYRLKRM